MAELITLKLAQLHTPIFLAGTNLSDKLDPSKRTDGNLKLEYDRKEQELLVTYKDEMAIVPITNVVSMVPGAPLTPDVRAAMREKPKTAQASTPMGHVFAGEGHGKTGKDK